MFYTPKGLMDTGKKHQDLVIKIFRMKKQKNKTLLHILHKRRIKNYT